ncbi:MAG: glucokinase [Proteobacteria bacterium]|nr:glucokinase [Pseudomonadota bacterium]
MNKITSILVADIGGTNSRFAKYLVTKDGMLQLFSLTNIETSKSTSFPQLLALVKDTNEELCIGSSSMAVFAVPGPIINGSKARLVNVSWDIDISDSSFLDNVYLINDFEAQAFGCMETNNNNVITLKETHKNLDNGFIVIGAGTGLGHCALRIYNNIPITFPSEAGQIYYPFQNEAELEYREFLKKRFNGAHPNGDKVVSGLGLSLLHEFLTGKKLKPEDVARNIGVDSETTIWFAKLFARDCKNYALSFLGLCDTLFLTGGVIIKNPFLVKNNYFLEEFINSDTKKSDLENISIKLVTDENIGLLGCAKFGKIQAGYRT